MRILQRSNYIIYFDDVRVDRYVVSWNTRNGLFANEAMANIVMFRSDAMDKWKGYLTQVKVFGENPFTKKFTLLFDGELMNRSWNQNKSNMGTVTFQAKGFYHWLDIPVPLGISNNEGMNDFSRFIYEAQGINIDEVRHLITNQAEILGKDKNIEEVIQHLFKKLTIGYYDVMDEDTAFNFANIEKRFQVMVDVMEEFTEAGFLDLFTFTQATQIESFYVFLNDLLSQLMFEFYQDRDGSFRIKTPSWSDPVLKAHTIDASIVQSISGMDDWEQEPTRVLAIGAETQLALMGRGYGTGSDDFNMHLHIPIGLYVGNPRNPEEEEYYSTLIKHKNEAYGSNHFDVGLGGFIESGEWFDNTSGYRVNSGHHSAKDGRAGHRGTDYNFVTEPVYNIGGFGTVTAAGNHSTMGNYVVVQQVINETVYHFRYMHFNSLSVSSGQQVAPGQQLGISGNTGRTSGKTGNHLHLEIWNGKPDSGQDVDPVAFLARMNVQAGKNASQFNTNSLLPGSIQTAMKAKELLQNSKIPPLDDKAGAWATYKVTAYDALCAPIYKNGRQYQGCTGITASGLDVKDNTVDHRVIAVDPTVIPLHSIVEIEGLGLYSALDTGGMIKGNVIDLLVQSDEVARIHGVQHLKARIVRRGKGKTGEKVPNRGLSGMTTIPGNLSAKQSGTIFNTLSNPYAAVDSMLDSPSLSRKDTTDFAKMFTDRQKESALQRREDQNPKPVKYPSSGFSYSVPAASADLEGVIKSNSGGIDPNLIAAVISGSSGWKERHQSSASMGIMGIPKSYVDDVLTGQNVMNPTNSINFGSTLLKNAMDRFGGKVSFALAAYHLGSFQQVEQVTKEIGSLDFSKARGKFDSDTLKFVDNVIKNYADTQGGTYLQGDPHKNYGDKYVPNSGEQGPIRNDDYAPKAETDVMDVPDYKNIDRPKMSEEEKKYKINFKRVEQALIRNDSPLVQSNAVTADKLIYQYAKYHMQLQRARTHNISVSLTTCLPFLRPGLNAWIEPTRTDVVCYITGVSHQGSFQDGCTTNITGGFVRSPDDYQSVDSSIFIGEIRGDSSVFGDVIDYNEMDKVRDDLNSLHDKDFVGEADDFELLKELYSSMNKTNEYTTEWNAEFTADEVDSLIASAFASAPLVVQERKDEIRNVIDKSEDVFLEKLLFTLHN